MTLGYLPARGFWPFLFLTLLHAAFLAPMTVLADALSLASSKRERFEYGWVRGTGSAAFIAGLLSSGQLVGAYGLAAIIWSQALLLALATLAAARVPEIPRERPDEREVLLDRARSGRSVGRVVVPRQQVERLERRCQRDSIPLIATHTLQRNRTAVKRFLEKFADEIRANRA